jgi:Protein of unknown function (DUF1353)
MAKAEPEGTEVGTTLPPQDAAALAVVSDPIDHDGPILVPPMTKPARIGRSGFFDPADPECDAQVLLRRIVDDGRELFELVRPIGYWHNEEGGIIVPANLAKFRTDLTSVPAWFTWLIPKSGLHLPAALIHDGLVLAAGEPKTYVAGHDISRSTADQIFRDGMRDLGTNVVRRWLMWTAVTLASLWCCTHKWWFRVVISLEVGLIIVLGAMATVDLLSHKELLPWMGHRGFWVELVSGAVFAVIVPAVLCLLWGRWWRAGIITGLSLAGLFHITIALAIISGLFQGVERLFQGKVLAALAWFGLSFGLLASIVALVTWAST